MSHEDLPQKRASTSVARSSRRRNGAVLSMEALPGVGEVEGFVAGVTKGSRCGRVTSSGTTSVNEELRRKSLTGVPDTRIKVSKKRLK